jgi:hypothetical protein
MREPELRFQRTEQVQLGPVPLNEVRVSTRMDADLARTRIVLMVAWAQGEREPMAHAPICLDHVVNQGWGVGVQVNEASHAAEIDDGAKPFLFGHSWGFAGWPHQSGPLRTRGRASIIMAFILLATFSACSRSVVRFPPGSTHA